MVYDLDGKLLGEVTVEHLNRKFDEWRKREKEEVGAIKNAHRRGTAGRHLLERMRELHMRRDSVEIDIETPLQSPQPTTPTPASQRPTFSNIFVTPNTPEESRGSRLDTDEAESGIPSVRVARFTLAPCESPERVSGAATGVNQMDTSPVHSRPATSHSLTQPRPSVGTDVIQGARPGGIDLSFRTPSAADSAA